MAAPDAVEAAATGRWRCPAAVELAAVGRTSPRDKVEAANASGRGRAAQAGRIRVWARVCGMGGSERSVQSEASNACFPALPFSY
jgi:hypothetical protein